MVRTKQTARVSLGGRAPRRQLAALPNQALASIAACTAAFASQLTAAQFVPPTRTVLETPHQEVRRVISEMVRYPDVDMGLATAAEKPLLRLINTLAYALLLLAEQHGGGEVAAEFPFEQGEDTRHRDDLWKRIGNALENCQMSFASPRFPVSLAEHFLTLFRQVNPQSHLQLQEPGRLRLMAVLDTVCETLIEAACESAMRRYVDGPVTVRCSDLLTIHNCEDEHGQKVRALSALFAALQEPLATLPSAAKPSTSLFPCHTPMLQMLADQFAERETLLQRTLDSSWACDAAKVNILAAQYAQLQLRPLPLLRPHAIRPLQYYGRVTGSLLDTFFNAPHHVFSLELQDSTGRWRTLVIDCPAAADLPNKPYRVEQGTIFLADAGDAALSWQPLARIDYRSDAGSQISASTQCVWTATLSLCSPRSDDLMGFLLPVDAHTDVALSHVTDGSSSSSSCAAPADVMSTSQLNTCMAHSSSLSSSLAASKLLIVTAGSSDPTPSGASSSSQKPPSGHVSPLEHVLMVAVRLVDDIYRSGPLLFSANQPMHVRAPFTAQLLDIQSQAAGLPVLPTALLQIIGEYAPADLPLIESSHGHMNEETHISRAWCDSWSTFHQPIDLDATVLMRDIDAARLDAVMSATENEPND